MARSLRLLHVALLSLFLAACGQEQEAGPATSQDESAAAIAKAEAPMRATPDFGGTERVSREAEGVGSTPQLATLAALQSVVAQVNGVQVAGQLESVRAGLNVSLGGTNAASIDADAFQERIASAVQGLVLGYEILSQEEVDKIDAETIRSVRASDEGYRYSASASASGNAKASASVRDARALASTKFSEDASVDMERGASSYSSDITERRMRSYWKVKVRADIAQYRARDEDGRPRITVAQPRVRAATYEVGDNRVDADEIARAIRGRLSDTLTQTTRFVVLEREFGQELQEEIDHINSGNVRQVDTVRLGQQLATDLILIPTIERFEYPRSTRRLRMSDRQVSSYSGGGRITLRLLNAATGEVVMSDSFDHQLAATGPSTLPRVVDGKSMAAAMMDALSGRIGTAVVTGIFPVSVVALEGDQVVLSQGGDILAAGQRYQAVLLGDALSDPQTGRALGRAERRCCVIRIDRVAAQTSYGTIEDGASGISGFKPGSIELREALKVEVVATDAGAQRSTKGVRAAAPAPAQRPAPGKEDPNW